MSDCVLYLPVSVGEAIDKLTILDIKLEKITDARKYDVEREYRLLHDKLSGFVNAHIALYNTMRRVNLLIWNKMDRLRDCELDTCEYLELCKETIEYNDVRFRIKNKMNHISKSQLKEQKGYKISRVLIDLCHNTRIPHIILPITYLSFFYDEVVIVHNQIADLEIELTYDPTILFLSDGGTLTYNKRYTLNNEVTYQTVLQVFGITEQQMRIIM